MHIPKSWKKFVFIFLPFSTSIYDIKVRLFLNTHYYPQSTFCCEYVYFKHFLCGDKESIKEV